MVCVGPHGLAEGGAGHLTANYLPRLSFLIAGRMMVHSSDCVLWGIGGGDGMLVGVTTLLYRLVSAGAPKLITLHFFSDHLDY